MLLTVLLVRVIDTSMVAAIGWHLQLSRLFYIVIVALFLATLFSYLTFIRKMTHSTAKQLERTAGIYIIAFDAALAIDGVVGLDITVPIGAEVVPLPESDRYLGFLFARAATPDAVESALRAGAAALDIVVG